MKFRFLLVILLFPISLFAQIDYILTRYWTMEKFGIGYSLEVADVNRDGQEDIVLGNWNTTAVYFKTPDLNFKQAPDIVYAGRVFIICDYNGDGYKDMICMHLDKFDSTINDYHGEFWFYMGKPNTKYLFDTIPDFKIPLPATWPVGQGLGYRQYQTGVMAGDFNGDHKADIVIPLPGRYPGKIFIYMGCDTPKVNPDFTITCTDTNEYDLSRYYDIADMNGDGYDDFLYSTIIDNRYYRKPCYHILHIFNGGPHPDFTPGKESQVYRSFFHTNDGVDTTRYCAWFTGDFSIHDINADGIPDMVVGASVDDQNRECEVHFGKKGTPIDTIPSMKFQVRDTNYEFFVAQWINVGDVNGDGLNDYLVSPCGFGVFGIILGGKHVSPQNPIGMAGYLSSCDPIFPQMAKNIGKLQGNNLNGMCMISIPPGMDSVSNIGAVLIYYGESLRTDVKEQGGNTITKSLSVSVYPNPFNPSTTIQYELKDRCRVKINIYDVLGNRVAELRDEMEGSGLHQMQFAASPYHLASGIYICEISAGANTARQKVLYLK